jgi:hypothetical protein
MSRLTRPLALALVLGTAGCAALQPAPPADRDAALRLESGLAALEAGRTAAAYEELAWVAAHCTARSAGLHARLGLVALELDPRNEAGRPAIGTELLAELILDETTPLWLRPALESSYLMARGLGAPAPGAMARAPADEAGDAPQADPPVTDTAAAALPPADTAAVDTMPVAAGPPEPVPDEAVEAPAPLEAWLTPADGPVYGCGEVLVPVARPATELPTLPGPSLAAMLTRVREERDAQAARATGLDTEIAELRRQLEATRAELDRIRRTLRP